MGTPPAAVAEDEDDQFDWEAAVREIDVACALASASSSAPPPRPPSRPSSARPIQTTLDLFVSSFTERRKGKEAAAADDGGSPGVPAGERSSGEANEMDGVAAVPIDAEAAKTWIYPSECDSFNKRKQAAADGGSRRVRAGERSSGDANEVDATAAAVQIDVEAAKSWIYPTNVDVREYQFSFVQEALFTNTLVALPTGLGKTFIAAVVMFNYFRWFPQGKIVFTAPSRPLVVQQIEACHNTVGIPQEWTIDMTGQMSPSKRSDFWKSRRVFFVTPQILEKDIQSGICSIKQLVCLVIDEAHRALGNHSYCVAIRELMAAPVQLRILALTATPGSKHMAIQNVISNLCISELAHRDEDDPDVSRYVHNRKVELIQVPVGDAAAKLNNIFLQLIQPHVAHLRSVGVLPYRDAATWSSHELLNIRDKLKQAPPPNIYHAKKGEIEGAFGALVTLCHIRKLLSSHGIRPAYEMIQNKLHQGYLKLIQKNETFWNAKLMMERSISSGVPSPKVHKMIEVLINHFKTNHPKDSRVMIFSNFRESIKEIMCSLENIGNDGLVRATEFIGQSSGKTLKGQTQKLKGQTQKVQQAVLQKFRDGGYNVIVATSIGEEGLDIIEVDLVICFDANISPLRMIQRMGRTGRKQDGRVVVLACEGMELKGYLKKQATSRTMKKLLRNPGSFEYHPSPRMVPHMYKPEVKYVELSIEKYVPRGRKIKINTAGTSPILSKVSDEEGQLIARYFGGLKEDTWKPSLIAFSRFQADPCDSYRVPHSFRTTAMLIDAMQQLQNLSFSRKKEFDDMAAVKDELGEDFYGNEGVHEAMFQDECYNKEASTRDVLGSKSGFSVASSPIRKHRIHSFLFGEDYVTVDAGGYVSIAFVPLLPNVSVFCKETNNKSNEELCPDLWNAAAAAAACKSSPAGIGMPAIALEQPTEVLGSDRQTFADNVLNLAPCSPKFAECWKHDVEKPVLKTPPSKTIFTSSEENCETPCNAKLPNPASSSWGDIELSPRLTHFIEEGIVPESPMVKLSYYPFEVDNAGSLSCLHIIGSSKSRAKDGQNNVALCRKISLSCEKNNEALTGISDPACFSIKDVQDRIGLHDIQVSVDETETKVVLTCPANKKQCTDIQVSVDETETKVVLTCAANKKQCTPLARTPTENLLCDSFSEDVQVKSGDASGSVQQVPRYRRLCKYGDKIKRVSSLSLGDKYAGFVEEDCHHANRTISNQMKHAEGSKGKLKRRLDTYIDEEAEVSADVDVSEDEDDHQNDDKYDDSFIDDQTNSTEQFSQAETGEDTGKHAGDMMAFYRRSLLTQSPIVLPRYLDASENSASRTSGNASCSSENLHNSFETPQGVPSTHHPIDPSPLSDQRSCMVPGRASLMNGQSETIVVQCEPATKLASRKRKLSFQQAASAPIANVEPRLEPEPSVQFKGADDGAILDDDNFYQSLDLDAVEAQATELWRLRATQSTQEVAAENPSSSIQKEPPAPSCPPPPSFDLGF